MEVPDAYIKNSRTMCKQNLDQSAATECGHHEDSLEICVCSITEQSACSMREAHRWLASEPLVAVEGDLEIVFNVLVNMVPRVRVVSNSDACDVEVSF